MCVYICILVISSMQIASFLRSIMLSYLAWLALQYFLRYLINGTISGIKVTEHKNACFDFICNLCLKYFSLRGQRDIDTNVQTTSCKVLIFLLDFIETWIFEQHSIIKFHENPSSENRVVPYFSQFFERAWLWRNGSAEVTCIIVHKYVSESCRNGGKCGDRVRRLLSSYESSIKTRPRLLCKLPCVTSSH
jgi:hypothetical protein